MTYVQLINYLMSFDISTHVMDIGTRDLATSNIYPFILRGSKALCVEANPLQVKVIEDEIDKLPEHTAVTLIPKAISTYEGHTDFIQSTNIGHSRIPNTEFDRLKWQSKMNKISVECTTLNTILLNNPEFINSFFVSIDLEGLDEMVLNQIIESDFRPKFVLSEHMNDDKRIKIQQDIMKTHYYVVSSTVMENNNTLFVLKNIN